MVSEEAFCVPREIAGRQAVTTSLLGCLDTPNAKAAALSWVIEFLKQQRASTLYTIEYASQQCGFGPAVAMMEKKILEIDALLARLRT